MTTAERLIKIGFDIGFNPATQMCKINVIRRGYLNLDAPLLALILKMPLEEVKETIGLVELGLI